MKKIVFLPVVFIFFTFCAIAQPSELMVKTGNQGLYLDHKVAPKEGLYAIGRLYSVNPKYISLYNKISIDAGLAIGQVLQIPLTDTNFNQGSYTGTPVYYQVNTGNTLPEIGKLANNVALQKLRDWNGLQNDRVSPGTKLIVGFLNSKEMAALAINNSIKKQASDPQLIADEQKVKNEAPEDNAGLQQVSGNINAVNDLANRRENAPGILPEKNTPIAAVSRDMATGSVQAEQGYFKTSFDVQAKRNPATKDATVTSGIFKTNSGWQDAKYYMLIDKVPTGTIVKLINPGNNTAVYAKVLGQMDGIRQNEGLDIRISNAAAAALGITDTEKFILKINY